MAALAKGSLDLACVALRVAVCVHILVILNRKEIIMNIVKRTRKENDSNELATSEKEFWPTLNRDRKRVLNRIREFFEDPFSIAADLAPWPAIDMNEDDKAVTLNVDLPGVNPKDIEVNVSGSQLTIRGSREEEKKSKTGGVWRQERHEGSFLRSVTLPSYVDPGKIEARYEKGVLTVAVAQTPGAGPKRVPVKSE